MWMIFIGPLVSQSMPMNHYAGMPMTPMPMPMDHGSHAVMDPAPGTQSVAASSAHGQGSAHGDGHDHAVWEACGYCNLLFSCPALPQTLSPLGLARLAPAALPQPSASPGHARQAVFPNARCRAPPHSIVA